MAEDENGEELAKARDLSGEERVRREHGGGNLFDELLGEGEGAKGVKNDVKAQDGAKNGNAAPEKQGTAEPKVAEEKPGPKQKQQKRKGRPKSAAGQKPAPESKNSEPGKSRAAKAAEPAGSPEAKPEKPEPEPENAGEPAEESGKEEKRKEWQRQPARPSAEVENLMREKEEKRRAIKETILMKAAEAGSGDLDAGAAGTPLNFLHDAETGNVFIGRKKSVWKQYGYDGALHIGRVDEHEFRDANVYMDGLNPHVIFVCGARGSGKSYVMGVLAEELAMRNKNTGIIVIDPVGVFWSMKMPNREEKELRRLEEWGLKPQGMGNIRVFVPEGVKKKVPKATYDSGFSIQPTLLTAEDWALTFGIERFSPTGLLLGEAVKKVEQGYKQEGSGKPVKGKEGKYSLDDLIVCLETDAELNSRERGYKKDSIRALVSRFEAAKGWGIFDEKGTPLSELSRENQMTILDTSFLDENVTALVIGILARRILSARKISTRKEAAHKFKMLGVDELLELEIPPTWLFIDEAHTLIPSGNAKTPATASLVEYVKQGRRPGCSIVFATQQPSAIDTKVLSQLDVMITHKLVFDDDIKAVYRRTPTIIPMGYKRSSFIKTLPIGVALVGDRSEDTTRAFVMRIRPRLSQHEGRDAESVGLEKSLSREDVMKVALELIINDLKREQEIEMDKVRSVLATLNAKYKSKIKPEDLFGELQKRGLVIGEESIALKGAEGEGGEGREAEPVGMEAEVAAETTAGEGTAGGEAAAEKAQAALLPEGETELLSLPQRISEENARKIADGLRAKKFLGLVGENEEIRDLQMRHVTVWKVRYDAFTGRREFITREAFINSLSGEFIHFQNGTFVESNGLKNAFEMGRDEIRLISTLGKRKLLLKEVCSLAEFEERKAKRMLGMLAEKGIAETARDKKTGAVHYSLKAKIDLPPDERHEMLGSLNALPFVRAEVLAKEREKFPREQIPQALQKLWPKVLVRKVEEIYMPVWFATLALKGKERTVAFDGVTGRRV